jgi:glycosyltransferase involved in cell wall biosynthesis
VIFSYLGIVKPPLLYLSIGLPERLVLLKSEFIRSIYRRMFSRVERIFCFGFQERLEIIRFLGCAESKVVFVPMGVDTDVFEPMSAIPEFDIVSIGADRQRDFKFLVQYALRHPDRKLKLIAGHSFSKELRDLPHNVTLLINTPFADLRRHLNSGRIIALPVKNNSYSGATTTLLQAMAMGKATVVTRTDAIRDGYHLEDGQNCHLVEPGCYDEFELKCNRLLSHDDLIASMGTKA